jgi:hypothetical protein
MIDIFKYYYSNSQMIELLKDPDTIPFTNGNTIDLNSLKN